MAAASASPAGRVTAGQRDVIIQPRRPTSKRPVVYCHGATVNALAAQGANGPGLVQLLHGLADQGRTILVTDLGTSLTNWGNAAAMTAMTAAVDYIAPAGTVHLLGSSMGAATALNWTADNRARVLSVATIIPGLDLQSIRVESATIRTQIDAAWGVTYPAALPAGASPYDNQGDFTGLPFTGWYASDDLTAFVTPPQTFATNLGGTMTSLGAVGHTDAAHTAVPVGTLESFFDTYDT